MSETENILALLRDPAADRCAFEAGAYLHTAGLGAAGRRRGTRSEETGAAPSSGPAGNSLWNCDEQTRVSHEGSCGDQAKFKTFSTSQNAI